MCIQFSEIHLSLFVWSHKNLLHALFSLPNIFWTEIRTFFFFSDASDFLHLSLVSQKCSFVSKKRSEYATKSSQFKELMSKSSLTIYFFKYLCMCNSNSRRDAMEFCHCTEGLGTVNLGCADHNRELPRIQPPQMWVGRLALRQR